MVHGDGWGGGGDMGGKIIFQCFYVDWRNFFVPLKKLHLLTKCFHSHEKVCFHLENVYILSQNIFVPLRNILFSCKKKNKKIRGSQYFCKRTQKFLK